MPQVSSPTLFVLGSADQMTPPEAAKGLIDLSAQPEVVTLNAGHSLMTEAPEGVLKALNDFLNK
jgi:pimeloyl-ACP methyl ester carboxylesterase